MSYTELQSGKFKVIGKMSLEEVDNYCKNIVEQRFPEKYEEIIQKGFPCWSNGWFEVLNDTLPYNKEMFIYSNETLCNVFNIKNHEDDGYFCNISKINDDEYEFITQYYNGGTCLSEILDEEISKL